MTHTQSVTPLLVAKDAAGAVDFYQHVFGARELARVMNNALGVISHADLEIGTTRLAVTEELPGWNTDAPDTLGGSPVVLQIVVDDVDARFAIALEAGAEVVFPLGDFGGVRMGRIRDPFGHLWILQDGAVSPKTSGAYETEPVAGNTVVETKDGPMPAFEARAEGPAAGLVVVFHEAFGLNAHIAAVTRRFSEAGFHAIAPALDHRSGSRVVPYDDLPSAIDLGKDVTDSGVLTDLDATIAHVGVEPGAVAVVGFCLGGRAALLSGIERPLGAAISFYGTAVVNAVPFFPHYEPLVERAPELLTPWLGLFGDQDAFVPVDGVEALRAALEDAEPAAEVIRYPHATHGFFNETRPSYDEESARDAWARVLSWLREGLR